MAKLLWAFNTEFEEATPPVAELTERIAELIGGEEVVVVVDEAAREGLALLRFRPAIWTAALEAYLAELYVIPERRGQGLGRALLEAAIAAARDRGADHIDLATSVADTAARGLYESAGFSDREGDPDGPQMIYYERRL